MLRGGSRRGVGRVALSEDGHQQRGDLLGARREDRQDELRSRPARGRSSRRSSGRTTRISTAARTALSRATRTSRSGPADTATTETTMSVRLAPGGVAHPVVLGDQDLLDGHAVRQHYCPAS
ncbi:hypothetical protein AQI70_28650 [Streptomyces curacoi]|uniref:Uncharacterized protein n=1 Tax=Streptomyces curacoi TaxID=146536 RepID=A0A117P0A2_9ACTN|nr:hypothetical protein AQI70_28650 [Streptomyces curacoi]